MECACQTRLMTELEIYIELIVSIECTLLFNLHLHRVVSIIYTFHRVVTLQMFHLTNVAMNNFHLIRHIDANPHLRFTSQCIHFVQVKRYSKPMKLTDLGSSNPDSVFGIFASTRSETERPDAIGLGSPVSTFGLRVASRRGPRVQIFTRRASDTKTEITVFAWLRLLMAPLFPAPVNCQEIHLTVTCYARVATLFVSKSVARAASVIAKKRLMGKQNFRFSGSSCRASSRQILRVESGLTCRFRRAERTFVDATVSEKVQSSLGSELGAHELV